jgi:hypothetical protein
METQSLIADIARAFPPAPAPNKEKVLYAGAYSGDPELEEITEFFGGRPWTAIGPKDVFRFRHALSFFSPSAFAYYIAGWMTCSLVAENEVDTAIEDLVYDLGRVDANLWTRQQRCAICAWLLHFKDVPLKERLQSAITNLGCEGVGNSSSESSTVRRGEGGKR